MKLNLRKAFQSSFVKNVLIMATGVAGAQAVTVALSPIITRLYGPEAFGIMGTFNAITKIIIPIAALSYPVAIVLPKNDNNAKGLLKLSLYITLIIASIFTVILFLFDESLVSLFKLEEIAPFLYLIPLVILFAGLMQVLQQWFIRTKQFKITAKVNFYQSIITNFSKVGIGLFYPFASVLVILQVTANGLKALMMILQAKKSNHKATVVSEDKYKKVSIKTLAKTHRDFPLYRAPEEFLSALSQSLPILLLTSFFGPAAAGFYNIGRTVLALPSTLIGQSIGDVFYPHITEAANKGEEIKSKVLKATLVLAGIGLVPFGMVIIFGPTLFEFIFGSGWNVAGEYARWIALTSFSTFINKPSVRTIPVLSAQRFYLIFTIIRMLLLTTALVLGFVVFNSDVVAIALFGITGALLNLMLICIVLTLSGKYQKWNLQ